MIDVLDTLLASLAPHYDVEREIGAGGMARVFLAVEQHPHRRVAIKVLDPEVSTRLLRERFIREVDLSSNLSHPHIVPIFSAGEVDGLFYYVMPYVEGESLRHRLLRDRKLPLETALHIARDVADALAFAHGQGIIHRDIKPENILLSGEHAIVADFGIARAISAAGSLTLTQAGQPIGSPGYMSPEQAMALGDLDARTDIYSLGCVLFEMLAGESPVTSMTERRVHNWTAMETSKALQGAQTGVVRGVKHAISRALAPLPDDRFPTVTEFATALGAPAYRTSVPTRDIFAGGRGRRVALVLGVALALVGAGAGRHGVAVARAGGGADLAAARRGANRAAAGDGGARDAVRLTLEPVGQDHRPAAHLRGVPGVHPGPGPHGAVRLARRHRSLPARRAGGHELPAAVDLRGARAYGPRGVRDGGLDRARGGALSRAPFSARPALPHMGARPEPGRPAASARDRARDGRHRAEFGDAVAGGPVRAGAQSPSRNDHGPHHARARSRPVPRLVGLLVLSDLRAPSCGRSPSRAEGGARGTAAPSRGPRRARGRGAGARRPGARRRHHRATGGGAEPPATAGLVSCRRRPDRGARAGGARSSGGGAGRRRVGRALAGRSAGCGGALGGQPVPSRPRLLRGWPARRHAAPARGSRGGAGGGRAGLRYHAVDRGHHGGLARSGDPPGFSGSACGAPGEACRRAGFRPDTPGDEPPLSLRQAHDVAGPDSRRPGRA